jgi:hypothetical protein
MVPCRGRRRGKRWITEIPLVRSFAPVGEQLNNAGSVNITFEELEALRLVDLLELQQQEAAYYMGVSKKALWNDLRSARRKVGMALVYGLGINLDGGSYIVRDSLDDRSPLKDAPIVQLPREDELDLMEREMHIMRSRLDDLRKRIEALKGKEDLGEVPP